MCKCMSIIWRIIGAVSIISGIIGKKKKRNSRKHNRKILEHSRLKPIDVGPSPDGLLIPSYSCCCLLGYLAISNCTKLYTFLSCHCIIHTLVNSILIIAPNYTFQIAHTPYWAYCQYTLLFICSRGNLCSHSTNIVIFSTASLTGSCILWNFSLKLSNRPYTWSIYQRRNYLFDLNRSMPKKIAMMNNYCESHTKVWAENAAWIIILY